MLRPENFCPGLILSAAIALLMTYPIPDSPEFLTTFQSPYVLIMEVVMKGDNYEGRSPLCVDQLSKTGPQIISGEGKWPFLAPIWTFNGGHLW